SPRKEIERSFFSRTCGTRGRSDLSGGGKSLDRDLDSGRFEAFAAFTVRRASPRWEEWKSVLDAQTQNDVERKCAEFPRAGMDRANRRRTSRRFENPGRSTDSQSLSRVLSPPLRR